MRTSRLVPVLLLAACATGRGAPEKPSTALPPGAAASASAAGPAGSAPEALVAAPPPRAPVVAAPVVAAPDAPQAPAAASSAATSRAPAPAARELPFDPSPDDRPALGATGFLGTATVTLPDGTQAIGPRVAGVRLGTGLEAAGVRANDVLVGVGGTILRPGEPDPIGKFRELLLAHAPDTETDLVVRGADGAVRTVRVLLGRQPPPFARTETPAAWLTSRFANATLGDVLDQALALDDGAARYADVVARNRRHLAKRDAFRLREVTEAHVDVRGTEALAVEIASAFAKDPGAAAGVVAEMGLGDGGPRPPSIPRGATIDAILDVLVPEIAEIDRLARAATAAWSADDRAFVAANFAKLTQRLVEGELVADDEDVARERANRRTVALLARVDRAQVVAAARRARSLVAAAAPALAAAARADGRDGLLVRRETQFGPVEVWGGGDQRHTARCAFLFELSGNDRYVECAARADLEQPVSIFVDAAGDDLWAANAPFGLAGALGGVAVLADLAGDDQYLARDWAQGAAVAGYAELRDDAGADVYHAQHVAQGVGLAGVGVVVDREGRDLYTGARLCQGVGLPGGAGALVDHAGDDRYVCTGRWESEYGDPGQFSGWGQGCGYGFRNVASGGIGLLVDVRGDDVYEAGNFSQGGGYFYAWGVLWDGQGRDRYVGSRYAQGFAAHQAVGTFVEEAGDDLYQSHSDVAQGLSWDETTVVFHDHAGDDRYETAGFSLASAAHNGVVLFLDDAGDDRYAGLPAHAASNEYHGGTSFALFLDRGGDDVYAGADAKEWNDRAFVRDRGAYHVDLPSPGAEMRPLLR